jgi:hypothetical protein
MNKDSNSSTEKAAVAEDLELVLEAARRANWDAQRGPAHLRSGRFFISELHKSHSSKPEETTATSTASPDVGT